MFQRDGVLRKTHAQTLDTMFSLQKDALRYPARQTLAFLQVRSAESEPEFRHACRIV